jgi:2'-5' RNA ligase
MSNVYTSAVVIIPPKEKWAPIQEIRESYDQHIDRWMPHITLLYPFKAESEYPTLELLFSDACKKISSFELSLTTFKFFKHGKQRHTLWLDPIPSEKIDDLQGNLLNIVPECNDVNNYENGFIPHLSVGQIKGKSNLFRIIAELQDGWEELNFHVDKIYFISREKSKTSSFEIVKRIQLHIE